MISVIELKYLYVMQFAPTKQTPYLLCPKAHNRVIP